MLNETLALSVGPSIAKAIIKFWCKDNSLASDAATSVIDFIIPKFKNQVERKKVARLFEKIGEDVAESLLPFFEIEGATFDVGTRDSIAIEIANTINRAKIDPELLLSTDLDPADLYERLAGARTRASYQFSESESAFFLRALRDVAQGIVDIATQLPLFDERSIAEILKRESSIQDIVTRVLDEVKTIRAEVAKANPGIELARFESDYRLTIARKLDEIELYGIDLSPASRKHKLSVAYISLQVETKIDFENEARLAEEKDSERAALAADPSEIEGLEKKVMPVDAAFSSCNRWVVRGLAGAGKTTLLQWIAVRAARKELEEPYKHWNDYVPFFVRLREFVEKPLPQPEILASLMAPAIAANAPQGWAHQLLREGRALVLVDGVDEIPMQKRDDARTWLVDLVGAFPKAVFIVTSRPVAISNSWLADWEFSEAELLPMEKADIEAFVDHWHNAVSAELSDSALREELRPLAAAFKLAVETKPAIRNLATTPLLCAMLCALHRDRRRQIPSSRLELYQTCVDALIDRRDIERRISATDSPSLTLPQKRTILEDLAYWLIENGWTSISRQRAEERIQRTLRSLLNLPRNATPTAVIRLLVERSGVIREAVVGEIDFSHRTFQEFLAARMAVDQGNIGVLIQNATNDSWREVIVLAAGLARKEDREELLKALIARGDQEPASRHRLHLMAVACLETTLSLDPTIRGEIEKRVKRLVPPKNMSEANALASAGDLAVPYIEFGSHSATVSASCVRALGLVASEAAFAALATYRNDLRRTVRVELVKAWDRFDRIRYVKEVLSPTVQSSDPMVIRNVSSLDGIEHLRGITQLVIENSTVNDLSLLPPLTYLFVENVRGRVDLKSITHLQTLKYFGCNNNAVSGFRYLSNVSNLEALTLYSSRSEPNEVIGNLANLDRINVWNTRVEIDFRSLTKLSRVLITGDATQFDFGALGAISGLNYLSLNRSATVRDLSFLSNARNLRFLDLKGCTQLEDLTPLAGLNQLHRIDLRGCTKIRSLEPLKNLQPWRVTRPEHLAKP